MSDLPNVPIGSAKKDTLFAMKISSIWIGTLTLTRAGFLACNLSFLSVNEIVYSGLMIGMIYAPVYISIILDKIKDIVHPTKDKNEC